MPAVFNLLNKKVASLAKKRFKRATVIQKLAIPKIIKGKNVLVIAGTGLGKTESVALPIFSKLVDNSHEPFSLLYLSPLKSLNRDLLDRLVWWSHKLDLEIGVRHGDTTAHQRKLQTEYPPHILISTPEQIQAMLSGKKLRKLLANIKYIIVDEIHEIADSKRGIQLTLGLERLKQLCGSPQIIALSATVGSPKQIADFIGCNEIVNAAVEKKISLSVKSPFPNKQDKITAEKIYIGDSVAARLQTMHDLIQKHASILTFTNTREAAEILSSRMRKLDKKLKQEIHHSSLSKGVRIKTEEDFKRGKIKSIVATSSLQLGIDIGLIDLVIQYQSPREVTQLTQRIGRSGHSIEKLSKGIIIAGEGDDLFESAVIARKLLAKELEPVYFHSKSWDVLSHQVIGLANDEYKIPVNKMYSIIKKAFPYKNLTMKEFLSLLKFMNKIRMIWLNTSDGKDVSNITPSQITKGGRTITLTRGRRALKYYFENLSTIPDTKNYLVIDITINKSVGTLDENFIAEHSETGSTFIVKGMPWKVISVEEGKVFVEPSADIESAVPSWEGELIPVPYEVAQEVGELRKKIHAWSKASPKGFSLLKKSQTKSQMIQKVIQNMKNEYPIDTQTANKMYKIIESQKEFNLSTHNKIVLEKYGEYTVLNACFGSRVNDTLARFISAMIVAEHGIVVPSKTDPYRIIFQKVSFEDIKNVLLKNSPDDIKTVLSNSLENSSLFRHRFLQIAKRFGVMRRGAIFEKINPKRLIRVYHSSPLYEETLNELFTEKLDIEKTKKVLSYLQAGKIKIIESDKLSPIGEFGLRYELHDVATPNRPEREILKVFKQRLMNTKLRLVCVNCGNYSVTYFVRDIPKTPRCPNCSSRLLSAVHPHMTEAQAIVKKRLAGKSLNSEELKKLVRIRRAADMLIVYGRSACEALAGRGIGPQTCARILARMHTSEDKFYKDLLSAERHFIATKKYWSD